jgi:pSer/pThr/pTyr-binding forkhead associated (FHA) protein
LARFTITGDGQPSSTFVIAPGETEIGRSITNHLVLEGDGVSRHHAKLASDGSTFAIEDAGSKNGTLVNGERLSGSRKLSSGDVVTIPGWTLRFDADEETVTRSATPAASGAAPVKSVILKPETREVVVRGTAVLLPPKEYLAMTLLYERAGTVVSKEDLAEHVWPEYKGDVSDYNIHQVLSRLRRELEEDPAHPRILITRPGFGYMLVP